MSETEAILKRYKLRNTPFRQRVVEVFNIKPHSALSTSQIESLLGAHDRITLYRTLKSFEDKGLIHQVTDGKGESKFALCHDQCEVHRANKEHAHFHCEHCDTTYCLEDAGSLEIQLPDQYQVKSINLALTGVCADCQ